MTSPKFDFEFASQKSARSFITTVDNTTKHCLALMLHGLVNKAQHFDSHSAINVDE